MYNILDFGVMINDKIRTDAYSNALQSIVNKNSIVVDIGTGTGILTLLACKFGAKKVYAIETNNAIEIAKELVAANGFSEKVHFIHDTSLNIDIPEKASIVVSDMHGALPICRQNLASIIDARKRFLGRDGVLIPEFESLWIALVNSPELYTRYTTPWSKNSYNLNLSKGLHWINNLFWNFDGKNEKLVVTPQCWTTLDYYKLEDTNVTGHVKWEIEDKNTVHGFRVWFNSKLLKGVEFSNIPGQRDGVYGSLFFPWPEPVTIDLGDTVDISISAKLIIDEYIWYWQSKIGNKDSEKYYKEFNQSTFWGSPLPTDLIRKKATSYKPILNTEGQILYDVISMMNEKVSLEDIAVFLCQKYHNKYKTNEEALNYVSDLSVKYSF